MNKINLFLSIALISVAVNAQTFVTPVGEKYLTTADDITIIPISGDSVQGSVKSITIAGSQIRSISIKDAAGQKHKFSSSDINLLKYKMSKMAKGEQIVSTASSSIENAVNTNYSYLSSMGYAVWENVKDPDGEDSYLLQVLNPWFCDYLKVYNVPKFVTVSSPFGKSKFSMPEELYVVKNGKTIEIKDKKYDKLIFPEIFGDCPELLAKVAESDRDWDDFPEHVKMYNDFMKQK